MVAAHLNILKITELYTFRLNLMVCGYLNEVVIINVTIFICYISNIFDIFKRRFQVGSGIWNSKKSQMMLQI